MHNLVGSDLAAYAPLNHVTLLTQTFGFVPTCWMTRSHPNRTEINLITSCPKDFLTVVQLGCFDQTELVLLCEGIEPKLVCELQSIL